MDIRNWGQTFMTRIKQLPSQAGQLANNLPESLGNLPEKAQAALKDLPQTLEDGAKSVLANEQVAEGWKLVGQGVGELVGYQPGDHIEISPSAKDPAGNIIKDPATKVPKGKPSTPKDPIGNAIKDASTTAKPKKPPVNVEPVPVEKPPVTPGENPLPNIIKDAGNETPATQITKTVRRARTPKTTGRVVTGVTKNKPPVPEVPVTPEVPLTPSPASKVLTNGAKVPVKVKDLKGAGEFTDVSKRLTQRASVLEQVGHPEEAQTLRDMADRMKRARTLYKEGNTPAAFRMVHAKNKLGLANPELQQAIKTSDKAEEVLAAFGKKPAAQVLTNGAKVPVKVANLKGASEFTDASKRLTSQAKLLEQMGRPDEAKTLTDMASRMKRASQLYKEGNTPAAFRMLHAKNKLGLANPELQEALRVSNKAEEVAAAFGKPAAVVKPVAKPFAAASEKMLARAKQLSEMGHPAEAKQLTGFAKKLTSAGEKYAAGDKEAAMQLFRKSMSGETQQALKVSNKAEEVFAAFGKKGATTAKAAKGATQAAEAGKAIEAGGEVVQTAEKAAETATKAAKAGKGAVAAESGTVATTITRSAKASKAAKAAESTGRTVTSSARVAEGVKTSKAAKAATQVVETAEKTTETAAKASKSAKAASDVVQTAEKATETATKAAKAGKGAKAAAEVAKDVTTAAEAGGGAANGILNGAKGILGKAKGMFGKLGESFKGFFGKIGKGASNSAGWQTIKQGFAKMLPGLGKAFKSSAIFSAVFSIAENLFFMLKGERTWRKALGNVVGDTLGGAVGGVVSALASGGAIAALGALGVVGLPLTLAAGAVGILGYFAFDRLFRNSGIYDTISHLFT